MHLVDSLGHSNIEYVCCHHEQTAAIAAQAYDMYDERLSVCLVTTGPGGTNALTGTAAAYVDSTPVIYMTGQVSPFYLPGSISNTYCHFNYVSGSVALAGEFIKD